MWITITSQFTSKMTSVELPNLSLTFSFRIFRLEVVIFTSPRLKVDGSLNEVICKMPYPLLLLGNTDFLFSMGLYRRQEPFMIRGKTFF